MDCIGKLEPVEIVAQFYAHIDNVSGNINVSTGRVQSSLHVGKLCMLIALGKEDGKEGVGVGVMTVREERHGGGDEGREMRGS